VEPKAIRWRAGLDRQEKITISRTIMEYALKEQQGVLVSDAARDERFAPAQSIVRFGIGQAVCVPMKGRHETLGVIYLDTRTNSQQLVARVSAGTELTEDHLMLAVAIGHQAALALEESHYYQAMVQHERLAAVGQTIAAVSHHVKNILQGLKTGTELIKTGLAEKNDTLVLQGWRSVEKNQGRIYNLVMDMLSYSKEREPALEPTQVNAVVRDVLELVQGRIQDQGVRLITKLDEKLPMPQADPEGLHRSLLNVIGNALDALEGREHPVLAVQTTADGSSQWYQIVVTDNGVGIPADKLNDLFRPFFSTKGSKGTGLGLAVSRKIIREHGGDILVQSQAGKGSRFTLRLPLHSSMQVELTTPFQDVVPPEEETPQ
jgi:C4-dicarboxylate-specific signal transduction histidine kinase